MCRCPTSTSAPGSSGSTTTTCATGHSRRCGARRRSRSTRRWRRPACKGGPGHWAVTRYDDVWYASRHPHIFSSSPSITINDANPELSEYLRVDDRHGRSAAPAAAQHRQQGVHPEGRRPHRGVGAGPGAPPRRDDDRRPSRRHGRGRRGVGRPAAAAGDLRHDGHPRGRPPADLPLDERDPRVRGQGHRHRLRGVRQGRDGHRRLRAPRWPRTAAPTRATT